MKPKVRLFRHVFYVIVALALVLPAANVAHMQGTATLTNYQAVFSGLSFSGQPGGLDVTYFPTGTQQVFARWNYQNVPLSAGVTLRRQWYRNGVPFVQKEEPWNPTWGSNGYLNHISIYDYTEGLTPGYYHVVISLMYDYPAAQVAGDFVIADYPPTNNPPGGSSAFSNLSVSNSAAGPDMSVFAAGTPIVSARWNYFNIPMGAVVQRDWYLNGVLFRSVSEAWSSYWGSSGRLTHIAIYDYERGLPSGNYRLNVFLQQNPAVQATVLFTVGSIPGGSGFFSNLTFSTTPDGIATGIFPRGTQQIYARWDFNNVSPENRVVRRWFRNGAIWLQREDPWTYGINGSVRNISIYDFQFGLPPGDYYVEVSLSGVPSSLLRGYFTIQ